MLKDCCMPARFMLVVPNTMHVYTKHALEAVFAGNVGACCRLSILVMPEPA